MKLIIINPMSYVNKYITLASNLALIKDIAQWPKIRKKVQFKGVAWLREAALFVSKANIKILKPFRLLPTHSLCRYRIENATTCKINRIWNSNVWFLVSSWYYTYFENCLKNFKKVRGCCSYFFRLSKTFGLFYSLY